jgi:hypothetical protein
MVVASLISYPLTRNLDTASYMSAGSFLNNSQGWKDVLNYNLHVHVQTASPFLRVDE